MDLRDKRVTDEIGRVTEGGRAKAVQQINIDIASTSQSFEPSERTVTIG